MSLDEQQILPGFPAPEVAPLPPGATVKIALNLIVRDPALQCRSALDESIVLGYVGVIDRLPPVHVIRVGDVDYLVDGWHRFEAHVRAKRTVIAAIVDTGDRRDAILAAVRANSSHGLPRSHEDTRRAVRVLLMDAEWCKLSDRKLAELADVSHTHVANQRKTYGVKAGVVLTPEEANRLDGKWSPEWEALKEKASYQVADLEKMRAVRTPEQLVKLRPATWQTQLVKAFDLRAEELAVNPWPWQDGERVEEEDEIAARFASLDTVQELLDAAASSTLKPSERAAAYNLVDLAREIERTFHVGSADDYAKAFRGRPALLARLKARVFEIKVAQDAKPKDEWEERREIANETDPKRQSRLVQDCTVAAFRNLDGDRLLPEVRTSDEFRWRWARRGDWQQDLKPLEDCPVPGCKGFVKPLKEAYEQKCQHCGTNAPGWLRDTRMALARVAALLQHDGYGFKVGTVIIDARTIAAIAEIKVNGSATVSMKGGLGKPCRSLVSQPEPTIIFVDNKPPPPASEEEAEVDIDEDCEAYQDGELAFENELDEDAEVLQYATPREQRNFLAGFKAAQEEDEVADG